MDEPESEDSNFIDDVMALLHKEETVQTGRTTNYLGRTNILNSNDDIVNQDFGLLIKEAEVVFEDGLRIEDVIQEEVLLSVNETDLNQDVLQEDDQPIPIPNNDEDLNDPDFVLSNDEIMQNSSENDSNIDLNENDAQNIENNSNADDSNIDHNENDVQNIENNANADTIINELARKPQDDLCSVEVLNDEGINGKRKRNKKPDRSSWDRNVHKKLRMTGKKYLGYKKVKIDGKIKVKRSEVEHEERKMGPVCNSKICKANIKRKCTEISEEMRHDVFKSFWNLSWKEKKVYICNHVKKINVQNQTVTGKASRRSGSFKYYLSPTTGDLRPVCKQMFLNTLGMKEWMVHNWASSGTGDFPDDEEAQHSEQEDGAVLPKDVIEQGGCREKKIPQKKKIISEWFESLPKVPSHYCRASTSKMYLEPLWDSKIDLYRSYKDSCTSNNKPYGSITLFMQVFEDKNLSLFVPKKDQCDTCYAFKAGNVSKENYDQHIIEKNMARAEKEHDKQKAVDGEIYCLTADMESVKLTPMTKASAMYYKTNLCSHNYTVYNLANRHCKCYWFSEVEGDLSANTFASCLVDYLREHCLSPCRPIVIYTDGCTNQNRNQFVSNALLHFAIQNNVIVNQKYLVKGHTQMEGDSVHARIEKQIKGKDVYLPFEYVKYTKEARQTPFPYEAVNLKHDFFRDFSNINYYDSVRPGRKKGDPCVVDVRCFQYLPTGTIQYKLSFDQGFVELPRRANKVNKNESPLQLFKERIPLPYSKWKHLEDLKYVIPDDYHHFYDSLPYKK